MHNCMTGLHIVAYTISSETYILSFRCARLRDHFSEPKPQFAFSSSTSKGYTSICMPLLKVFHYWCGWWQHEFFASALGDSIMFESQVLRGWNAVVLYLHSMLWGAEIVVASLPSTTLNYCLWEPLSDCCFKFPFLCSMGLPTCAAHI